MAHVHSYSQRDEDGIFLYDKNKRRIGGPYATEEEATRASKAVSEAMGERPVEDYKEFLRETNPGIIGGQSPIPESRREPTDAEFEAIFKERAREYRGGLLDTVPEKPKKGGSPLDWLIPTAGAAGLMPQEPASLFNTDFVTDVKYDPRSYRVPVNPDPSRYPADMSEVKFGTALPDRTAVEDMVLEASSISGVRPEYTEGHRTEGQNKLVGGHTESKHLTGQAFDLAISGNKARDLVYVRELRRLFEPLGFSVVLKSDHVHLQTPPKGVDLLPNSSWGN